ncbi:MAG: B12-binding domain-containing radical SAM protein [Syntrophorhabdaceae bacterium]
MKVLLVQPPIEDFYDTSIRTYPLALTYIAAAIQEICEVAILDCRTGYKPRKTENIFPELDLYYRDDRKTPFSLFTKYSRYGMDRPQIRSAIIDANPDLVGISSSFAAYSREASEMAAVVKEIDRSIITVMGGTHPTLFPEHILDDTNVDYVIRGEGETPFLRLIEYLLSGGAASLTPVAGVCFDNDGMRHIGSIHVEDIIDRIPARHLVSTGAYRIGKKPYTFFLTSRGCPFQCGFCGKPPIPYRRRSLSSIENEIAGIKSRGIEAIDFEDDMLNLDIPFFRAVLEIMRVHNLTLSAMNGLYSQTLDVDTLEKMYEAGFRRLNFSLVDTSAAVHASQKRAYPANFLKLLDWLESSPFLVEAHFIIGLPGQTPAEIIETMTFLMGKRLLPGPSIYYLAPGSPLFDELCGTNTDRYFPMARSSVMFETNSPFSRNAIFTFMKLLRAMNVIKDLIDRNPSAATIFDLPDTERMRNNVRDRHILSTLIRERRFIWFDTRGNDYVAEPQVRYIIETFFEAMKGKIVKGFRTGNSIRVP